MLYAEILADAVEGRPRSEVLRTREGSWAGGVASANAGDWRGRRRLDVRASGYVIHALGASLWSVGASGDFEEAVLRGVNLGEDADTTGAITGQLAGALGGAYAIPARWQKRAAWGDRIKAQAELLAQATLVERASA